MFSYYGSKSKIVNLYPTPKFDKIIEPFAGSARYSLKWYDKNILLVDKYSVIVNTWNWLQGCSKKDILSLPKLKKGDSLENYKLTKDENVFMSFLVSAGTTGGRQKVGSLEGIDVERDLKNIANQLFKIRHWKILQLDYNDIKNEEATWFIDPPYQFGGHEYKFSNKQINYTELATWCKGRFGQTIVCENTKADWLKFYPMTKMRGAAFTTTEAIWSNYITDYHHKQMKLEL